MMPRSDKKTDNIPANLTPSKRDKYSNYTPRKRYIKEQEQINNYHSQSIKYTQQSPTIVQEQTYQPLYGRNLSSSKKKYAQNKQNQYRPSLPIKYQEPLSYQPSNVFDDCTSSFNCRPSLRKQKFRKGQQQRDIPRKLNFQDENNNLSNCLVRSKYVKAIDDEPLTPRRMYKKQPQIDLDLNQKMAILNQKLIKLEKMTPKRSSTPKVSRVIQSYPLYHSDASQLIFQKEQSKIQSNISTSRTSMVSEKENELMSRVSLGRLVEEQQAENEIEVIQDLSYKISSKLQSIIRNFG